MKSIFEKNVRLVLITLICAALSMISGRATNLAVVNPGFETGSASGWSTSPSGGYGSGVTVINNVTNQSSQYPDFSNPLPGTASGTYYAGVTGYEGNPAEVLYQDITGNGQGNPTLQPNTTYTLTVAIGVGIYDSVNNGYIALINGTNATGTLLKSISASTLGFGNYQGTFKDLTVTFTTGATASGHLTIAIGTTHGYPSTGWMLVDNVRLTSVSTGPTTMAVVNSGFETGSASGWATAASGGYGSGVTVMNNVTNQSSQYPDFPNPLPGTGAGTYYATVTGYEGNAAEVLYQDVSANGQGNGPLQPNTTYTLTVAIGVGIYDSVNNGFIELINGTNASGTVLNSISATTLGMGNYQGTFKDLTVTFTTGATVSGDLTIAIGTTHGYPSTGWMLVDNVRLTQSSGTPPPPLAGGVLNGDFETGGLDGWMTAASGGYNSGATVINNVANQSNPYPDFPNPLPGTAAGTYYAAVTGYDGNSPEVLYQDVSANGLGNGTLQPNTTYNLLVSIGVGRFDGLNNGFVSLINGTNPSGTVLATANVSTLGMGNYAGTFRDILLTYKTGATVSGDLTIAIGTPHGYPSTGWMLVDNVRLTTSANSAPETIGGGSITSPAVGPQPSYGIGGSGFTLVKNWHFGTNGTIKNNTDLDANFQFHDQFNLDENNNYGARIVAPDAANAVEPGQPYEGQVINGVPVPSVRSFFADYMRTYIVPLGGATTITPASHLGGTINAGSGSFQAQWTLPNGGSLLGQDIIWETRVRYVTPPYFWFAIWNSGNMWNQGAEMDLVETFGFDNTPMGGGTNYTGSTWHSNTVAGSDQVDYSNFANGMNSVGIAAFDPTQYHIWTLAYYKNNTYALYVDGTKIQYGNTPYWWTTGATSTGTPINMSFLFDGTWGSTTVTSVDHSLAASALNGCYYEWNYSRVYLR